MPLEENAETSETVTEMREVAPSRDRYGGY